MNFLKPMNAPTLLTILATVAAAFAVTACARKSPTADYADMAPAVPKAEYKPTPVPAGPTPPPTPIPDPGTEVVYDVFKGPLIFKELARDASGTAIGKRAANSPTFHQGARDTYFVQARVLLSGVEAELILVKPKECGGEGITFEAVSDAPGFYKMSWTPKRGTLRAFEYQDGCNADFSFRYRIVKAKNPAVSAAMIKIVDGAQFDGYSFWLFRDRTAPEITNWEFAAPLIVSGDSDLLTVQVIDPSADANNLPTMDLRDESSTSTDNRALQISSFMTLKNVKMVDGVVRFQYLLETKRLPIAKDLAPGEKVLPGRFVAQVTSANGRDKSSVMTMSVKIERKPEPTPTPTPAPQPKPQITKPTATPTPTPDDVGGGNDRFMKGDL